MSDERELPIYQPKSVTDLVLRHKWINLSDGRVCVRELTAADAIIAMERAVRPKGDPRGGMDPFTSMVHLIALSCYTGEDIQARRVFSDDQINSIYLLLKWEFDLLTDTINEISGISDEEIQATEGFFGARPGPNNSSPKSGASSTSIGSPPNLQSRVTS